MREKIHILKNVLTRVRTFWCCEQVQNRTWLLTECVEHPVIVDIPQRTGFLSLVWHPRYAWQGMNGGCNLAHAHITTPSILVSEWGNEPPANWGPLCAPLRCECAVVWMCESYVSGLIMFISVRCAVKLLWRVFLGKEILSREINLGGHKGEMWAQFMKQGLSKLDFF